LVTRQGKLPFKDIDIGDLLRLNVGEFARKGALMPWRAALLARQMITQRGARLADGRGDGTRRGTCRPAPIRAPASRATAKGAQRARRTDDFRELAAELYLTATDLDTCERVVFGVDSHRGRTDLDRGAASGALPMVYSPVKIGDREADRRGDRLDDEPRHRDRGRGQVRGGDQSDRAVPSNDFSGACGRCAARVRGAYLTWASRRSAIRPSSSSPTSACTS